MMVMIDGAISSASEAKISVLDHGLLYGDGVFEGIGARGGHVVDLPRHLERLQRSARALHLDIPASTTLADMVIQTLERYGKADGYARLVVTRGAGGLGIDTAHCQPKTFCIAGDIALYDTAAAARGLSLVTVSLRRPDPDVLDPCVKSLNYLNNVLAKHEARTRGGDEALVLNRRGTVAEASGANLWARMGDELVTPPVSDGALPGITRWRVLQLAPELGLRATPRTVTRCELLAADEVFLTGTGAGLVAASQLDGCPLGGGEGASVLPRLRSAFERYARASGTPLALPQHGGLS